MPIKQPPSHTWPANRTGNESVVLGDESRIVGDESDDASALIELMFGPPYPQIRNTQSATARVVRRLAVAVQVRRRDAYGH